MSRPADHLVSIMRTGRRTSLKDLDLNWSCTGRNQLEASNLHWKKKKKSGVRSGSEEVDMELSCAECSVCPVATFSLRSFQNDIHRSGHSSSELVLMDPLRVFLLCCVVCVTRGENSEKTSVRHMNRWLLLRCVETWRFTSEGRLAVSHEPDALLSSSGQQEVTVEPEQSVVLQCRSPTCENVQVLTWSRPDLTADGYVYFYRNKRSYENYQLPSFQGRVELRDPDMKDGDVSVVLKNVTDDDAGTYSCYVSVRNMGGSKVTHSEMWRLTVSSRSGETPKGLRDSWTMGLEDIKRKLEEVLKGEAAAVALTAAAAVLLVAAVVVVVVVVVAKCLKDKPHVHRTLPPLNFIQMKK
ncbi:hypothetical protein INR49_007763 [Caranx melampygus]|nr:hypothetical protein INR49_007763 [Caranx melampygus]